MFFFLKRLNIDMDIYHLPFHMHIVLEVKLEDVV